MTPLNLDNLVRWFESHKRDLPWRGTAKSAPSPYAVWVSEVMLQQTQVKTVIPYFYKWMELFPTLTDLAHANEDRVIKAWEGLGYYSRARRLHLGAKVCVESFNGQFPSTPETIRSLPGIGPYTEGAILSFAYHQRAAAVDGNVIRVMSRLLGIEENVSLTTTKKILESATYLSLPESRPWVAMEALIELGALICSKKPQCPSCPLRNTCSAYASGKTDVIPNISKKAPPTRLKRHALIFESEGYLLLKKGEKGQVMEGLWEFPYFEESLPKEQWGMSLSHLKPLTKVVHGFTRFHVELFAYKLKASQKKIIENYEWIEKEKLSEIPFSSGHRKLLAWIDQD